MNGERIEPPGPEWFQDMVESMTHFGVISLDEAGAIRTWNEGARRLFAYEPADALGAPGSIIFTPEDIAAGVHERELRLAATEGHAVDDRWHARRDGTRVWASGMMMAIRETPGVVRGFVKVVQDRTIERRAEESLRQSEEQFARAFIANAAGIAIERGDTGAFVLANEAFLRLSGYWRAEVMGRSGGDLNLWAEPAQRVAALARLDDGGGGSFRLDLRTRTGAIVPCLAAAAYVDLHARRSVILTLLPSAVS